jgi:osmotically-inducible protein OsmY
MKQVVLLAALFSLSACFMGAVGTIATEGGVSVAEQRTFGSKVDDNVIYGEINKLYLETDANELLANVTIDVHNQRVMLTGDVKTHDIAQKAVEVAWRAKNVKEVINELNVNPNASIWDTASDALIKKNLEARYLSTAGTWVINYSISVYHGTVYLLGVVHNRAELDKVLTIAKNAKGAKKIVSHLKIMTETPAAPGLPPSHYNSSGASSNSYTPPSNDSDAWSDTGTIPEDAPISSRDNF